MGHEEIVDYYLGECNRICRRGDYTRLWGNIRSIKDSVLQQFSKNGYKDGEVLGVVDVCEAVLEKRLGKTRSFSWSSDLEKGIREGVNTALQEV